MRFLFFMLAIATATATATTIIIGDSMFAESPVRDYLQERCDCEIENRAIIGSSLHEGWVTSIPSQYYDIEDTASISTVIMDGGGNDVMSRLSDCRELNEDCKTMIKESVEIARSLIQQMGEDGVDLVIYLGFYYIQNLNKVIDYGTALLSRMCATSETPCVFCDPRNLTIPIGWDGLHPTREGFLMIGELISSALEQE
jgi:hypothetical protein